MTDSETNQAGDTAPLKTIRLKPIQPQAPAAAPAAPAPAAAPAAPAPAAAPHAAPHFTAANPIPGAKQTIRLRPSTMSGIGGAHTQQTTIPTQQMAAPSTSSTDTSRLARRTIKLVANRNTSGPDATIKMDKHAPAAPADNTPKTEVMDNAPKTEVMEDANKTDTSRLSKRTIKLTSAKPIQAPAVETSTTPIASQPTIKLDSNTNPASQQTIKLNANPASQQTIKLNASPASQQTIKLNTNPASQQTIKLNTNPASQQTIKLGGASGGKATQTIKLNMTQPTVNSPTAETHPVDNATAPTASNPVEALKAVREKSAACPPVFVITSAVALLVLGVLCLILYAQYANFYLGGNINVPGLTRSTGK